MQQKSFSQSTLFKFLGLCLVLAGYFLYLAWKLGFETGGWLTALTWSFFVLCTPVADAGFLLDFPIRILFKIRMVITEIIVWVIAIGITSFAVLYKPEIFIQSALTKVFYAILSQPWPSWIIIILCGIGTFLSIHFADEVYDVASKKTKIIGYKYKWFITALLYLVIIFMYKELLARLGYSFTI